VVRGAVDVPSAAAAPGGRAGKWPRVGLPTGPPYDRVPTGRRLVDSAPLDVDSSARSGSRAAFDQFPVSAPAAANEASRAATPRMFVNLSRRSRRWCNEIRLIDDLEQGEQTGTALSNRVSDGPLATLKRRNSETCLVLSATRSPPVEPAVVLVYVLRAAVSEMSRMSGLMNVHPGIAVRGPKPSRVVHLSRAGGERTSFLLC